MFVFVFQHTNEKLNLHYFRFCFLYFLLNMSHYDIFTFYKKKFRKKLCFEFSKYNCNFIENSRQLNVLKKF